MKPLVCLLVCVALLNTTLLKAQDHTNVEPAFYNLQDYPNVRDITISADESECYFTIQSPLEDRSFIARMTKENSVWSSIELVNFTGEYKDLEPFLSPDGLSLYFVSNRPDQNEKRTQLDFDIWYVKRESVTDQWGPPINLGAPINTDLNEFYPAITINNNLYFTSDGQGTKGKDDIFFSEWREGTYTDPISLSDAINTDGYEFNAFVAPDERFIIFTGYSRADGLGSGDLYISRKKADGTWTKSQNLGVKINSAQMDYCPFVNLKTNELFFTSKRKDYEVHAKVETLEEALKDINKYQNGWSRLYKTPFSVDAWR
jgi:hypothetical protein